MAIHRKVWVQISPQQAVVFGLDVTGVGMHACHGASAVGQQGHAVGAARESSLAMVANQPGCLSAGGLPVKKIEMHGDLSGLGGQKGGDMIPSCGHRIESGDGAPRIGLQGEAKRMVLPDDDPVTHRYYQHAGTIRRGPAGHPRPCGGGTGGRSLLVLFGKATQPGFEVGIEASFQLLPVHPGGVLDAMDL